MNEPVSIAPTVHLFSPLALFQSGHLPSDYPFCILGLKACRHLLTLNPCKKEVFLPLRDVSRQPFFYYLPAGEAWTVFPRSRSGLGSPFFPEATGPFFVV